MTPPTALAGPGAQHRAAQRAHVRVPGQAVLDPAAKHPALTATAASATLALPTGGTGPKPVSYTHLTLPTKA